MSSYRMAKIQSIESLANQMSSLLKRINLLNQNLESNQLRFKCPKHLVSIRAFTTRQISCTTIFKDSQTSLVDLDQGTKSSSSSTMNRRQTSLESQKKKAKVVRHLQSLLIKVYVLILIFTPFSIISSSSTSIGIRTMPYFSTNLEKTMDRLMISMILNTEKIKIRRAALKKENLVKKKVTAAMIQPEMRKLLISI